MKIEIVDDGVGAFATLAKLKSLGADFRLQLLEQSLPLGNKTRAQLQTIAKGAVACAQQHGAEVVVFSSIALSVAAAKQLAATSGVAIFGCEAPLLHAGTYTASKVLLAGDNFTVNAAKHLQNVIGVALPDFPLLARQNAPEREIVRYIANCAEQFYGSFDCIALGNSSMNLYKHCFSRVFPNAQIFDSLEGVARKLRKKYKKLGGEEGSVAIVNEKQQDLAEKYNIFLEEF